MNRYINSLKIIVFLSLILVGCASTTGFIVTKPKLHTIGKDDVKRLEIKLPERYAVDEFKDLKVKLIVGNKKDVFNPYMMKIMDILSSELGKIRKFEQYSGLKSVIALENELAVLQRQKNEVMKAGSDYNVSLEEETRYVNQIEKLQNRLRQKQGEINAVDPDYKVVIQLNNIKEEQKLNKLQTLVLFKVILTYTIKDNKKHSGKIIKSDKIVGLAKRYKIYHVSWDRVLRKYQYDQTGGHGIENGVLNRIQAEEKADKSAFTQASERVAKILVNRLGNSFPAGGKIVDWEEAAGQHEILIDSGIEQGLLKDQIMVLYKEKKSGAATPFGLAEIAGLGEKKTTLRLIKWKDNDAFANKVISALKAYNYKLASKEDFYAVAIAMPDPIYE